MSGRMRTLDEKFGWARPQSKNDEVVFELAFDFDMLPGSSTCLLLEVTLGTGYN